MIAQTIVLNCISFVFEFDHFFICLLAICIFIFFLCPILGLRGGFSPLLISKSSFIIGGISFGLSCITDIFYTLLSLIFVIRMYLIVICPGITMFASVASEFMSFWKDIFILIP